MSGNKILLDTNAVLYFLGGKLKENTFPAGNLIISFINELELLSYPNLSKSEENKIEEFIYSIDVLDMNTLIKQETIVLRKKYRIKLPDAIICATALVYEASLLTLDNNLSKIKEIKLIRPDLV